MGHTCSKEHNAGVYKDQGPALCGKHKAGNVYWYGDGPNDAANSYLGFIGQCNKGVSCAAGQYRRGPDLKTAGDRVDLCFQHRFSGCVAGTKRNTCERDYAAFMTPARTLDCCIGAAHLDPNRDCHPDVAGFGGSEQCTPETPGSVCRSQLPGLCDLPVVRDDSNSPPYIASYREWLPPPGEPATDTTARCRYWLDTAADPKTKSAVLTKALETFFAVTDGFDAPRGSEAAQFLDAALELCAKTPGACSTVLRAECAKTDLGREDLLAAAGAEPGSPADLKLRACACHLPANKYDKFQGVIQQGFFQACDPLCLLPGGVPPGVIDDATNEARKVTCAETNCLIDGVALTLIGSEIGDIDFSQTCGGCEPSSGGGGGSSGCSCVFENISVWAEASKLDKLNLAQNCGACKIRDPLNPARFTTIDCREGAPLPDAPGPQPGDGLFDGLYDFLVNNKLVSGVTLLLVVAFLVALVYTAAQQR